MSITIRSGLFSHMVLQRSNRNVSDAQVAGECDLAGPIRVTVSQAGRPLPELDGVVVGTVKSGSFSVRLRGIPAGGPYDIALRVADAKLGAETMIEAVDVLVGDVWLLAGQSNMEGIGLLSDALAPVDEVRAYYMDDRWQVARDPIHNLAEASAPVHTALCGGVPAVRDPLIGVGPGVAFGQEMRRLTGVPQGLISCAHGGTSVGQWDAKLKSRGGDSLYGAAVQRFERNGGRVAGLLWYQGESDALPDTAPAYTRNLARLFRAFRRDCGDSLPLAVVQISRVIGWGASAVWWNLVQEQQRRITEHISRCAVVPAIDLPLDDGIHLSGDGQNRLGRRLARAMHVLCSGRQAGKPPIELGTIKVSKAERAGYSNIVITFRNVEGSLQAPGRPAGFALQETGELPAGFDIQLRGNRAIIRTNWAPAVIEHMRLSYGLGFNPYCNITDQADRSLPVFGPVPFGKPRAVSDFVRSWEVSDFVPCNATLKDLSYSRAAAVPCSRRQFAEDFSKRQEEIAATAADRGAFIYRCRFRCPQSMPLQVLLGYDGPLRVWLDGKEVFKDAEGTNPASPNDAAVKLGQLDGEHELTVALGNNGGRAWGIYCRLERLKLTAAQRELPAAVPLPELID